MAYKYPYGNRDTINLDWFINEFQKLKAAWEEERAGIEGALDEEIARAEAALADVFAARDTATAAATAASQSADTARGYSETATAQANTATQAAQGAATARSDALAAQSAAEAAADNASGFASNASTSAQSAAQSVINARTAQIAAAQSATLADSARQVAQTAQTGAETAATNAATSADDAETAATSIEESAQQIASNTSDINSLKESISNYYISSENAILQSILPNEYYSDEGAGRFFTRTKNKISISRIAGNSNPRLYSILSNHATQEYDTNKIPTIDSLHPIAEIPLHGFFSIYKIKNTVKTSGIRFSITACTVTDDSVNVVTRIPLTNMLSENKYLYVEYDLTNTTATHFALYLYTTQSYQGLDEEFIFNISPAFIPSSLTALILENNGG